MRAYRGERKARLDSIPRSRSTAAMSRDPRFDDYISRAQHFAQPILHHLRMVVHSACPIVEEAMKWSSPTFMYKDRILCRMSAFRHHASFGFWERENATGAVDDRDKDAMGQYGRLTELADLPADAILIEATLRAMALVDAGAVAPRPIKHQKPPPIAAADFASAMAAIPAARTTFDAFPVSERREYVEWIEDAKRPETRARRIEQAVAQLAEGKRRNWRYM
jgi:uncharacterized protein YdeI (YjbR/CyaY-like superfamily)